MGFGIVIIGLIISLVVMNSKRLNKEDQEYLNLREYLLGRYIELSYEYDGRDCLMENHGLSEDNDMYVRFWCQDYDENHQALGEKQYHTLYFNRPHKDGAIEHGYAEALGD